MIRMLAIIGVAAGAITCQPEAAATMPVSGQAKGDYVVLLHGMGRSALSMKRVEWYLEKRGYRVINITYHSRRENVRQLSENYLAPLLMENISDPTAKVNFVTHSLGSIIVRQYLADHTVPNLGRVVMLAPPNHGSEIIDCLRSNLISRQFLGASACELGTRSDDAPNRLGPVRFECGVIAGDLSLNPFLSSLIQGPNDGKVSMASARVDGMRDFLVLHSTHTWLMWRERTLRQAAHFLDSGYFARSCRE